MAILVGDPNVEDRLLAERRASGADRYDEVWEGVYMMTPIPNTEHQVLVAQLTSVLLEVIDGPQRGIVCPGINLCSSDIDDWTQDYRVPDVAVLLHDGDGKDCDTHWRGGVDFLIEVTSPNDHTHKKLPFYSRIGVRELLIVERQTWTLELYRHQQGQLAKVGQSTPTDSSTGVSPVETLTSERVPLTFRLVAGDPRPQIEIVHVEGGRTWVV